MIRVRNTLAILAFTALFGCVVDSPASTPTLEQVNLKLQATYVTQSLTEDLSRSFVEEHPEFNINVMGQSYSNLMDNLEGGQIDYVISSYIPIRKDIWAAPIAQDGLVLIVHPDNPILNLDTDTIRDIYTGHITDWESLSNIELPMIPLTYSDTHDSYHEFHRLIMGRQRITGNAQLVPNIEAMIDQVADTPKAIGYIPLNHITSKVKQLTVNYIEATQETMIANIYPLRTTLFVIGREEPSVAYRTFFSWIQSQMGQAVVAQNHVPLP